MSDTVQALWSDKDITDAIDQIWFDEESCLAAYDLVERVRNEYQQRIAQLEAELAEARRWKDLPNWEYDLWLMNGLDDDMRIQRRIATKEE